MKPIKSHKVDKINNYSIAPYNFVRFPDKYIYRYESIEDLPAHNTIPKSEDLLNGYIEYTIEAKTPIMISNGDKEKKDIYFFKDLEGKYAIPANSIRGAIRTNSQILSLSNIVGRKDKYGRYPNSEIEDSRFLFRDVASKGILKKQYTKVLGVKGRPAIARNLKVGYIHKKGNKYFIKPSKKLKENEMYFKIKEDDLRKIIREELEDINFMYTNREKDGYQPYYTEISFDYNNQGKAKITNIYKPRKDKITGFLLNSNHMRGKLAHYIIPEPDEKQEEFEVDENTIYNYKEDMLRTKKATMEKGKFSVKENYKYYDLPKEGEVKPVFYIHTGDIMNIGFTPNLRVMYKNSVLDGVRVKNRNNHGISYVDSIYGFSNKIYKNKNDKEETYDYKSRISFTDVQAINSPKVDEESSITMLLASPSATSYPIYIQQEDNKLKTYEDVDFSIRGVKQYWLKEYIEDATEIDANDKMSFQIHPLKEGSKFRGKIYFKNLAKDELGLLLWSIKLAPNSNLNIGMAKPYGFGRIEFSSLDLKIEDIEKKYNEFSFDYYKKEEIDDYIKYYKDCVKKNHLKDEEIEKLKNIRELIKIKTYVVSKETSEFFTYMDLKGYKEKKPLPELLTYPNKFPDKDKKYNNKKSNIRKHYTNNNHKKRDNRNRKTNSNREISEEMLNKLKNKLENK